MVVDVRKHGAAGGRNQVIGSLPQPAAPSYQSSVLSFQKLVFARWAKIRGRKARI